MTEEFPMICENCLPKEKYIKMSRRRKGAACKLCDRPFDVYKWRMEDTDRMKKTEICLNCAKTKNLCQCCMLDLDYDLPYYVRDAALAQVNSEIATSSTNDANNQWLADVAQRKLALTGTSEYDKIDAANVVRQLQQKYSYDSHVPGAPKPVRTIDGIHGGGATSEPPKIAPSLKKAHVEKKPKKHQSFLN